ncbi:unnamed protein product [Eruca vesicaria subsp. sativa]|uniref:Uncharacterized protein n=1 Tax=Eruca vesicaria subsp. sativa TaxID=29727 RepID=A0ABC8KJC9_ERUVS|nr:unnamed protein product [Eruca vesicaria subsp. sativa]
MPLVRAPPQSRFWVGGEIQFSFLGSLRSSSSWSGSEGSCRGWVRRWLATADPVFCACSVMVVVYLGFLRVGEIPVASHCYQECSGLVWSRRRGLGTAFQVVAVETTHLCIGRVDGRSECLLV